MEKRKSYLQNLSAEEQEVVKYKWDFWARPNQKIPTDRPWRVWLIRAGRGYGKTRVGAETVRIWARTENYVNLIGATADDARDILIEGESGILSVCPEEERPLYKKSERKLIWPNGGVSLIFTADEPERLRGKQHFKIWGDELAAWRYPESFDQAMFGLRLGDNPQAVFTTTPKPTKLIIELSKSPTTYLTIGTSYENKANLAPAFFAEIVKKYENTRLGRQELNAELLEDNPGALWTTLMFDETRVDKVPENLRRIVVGIDPAVTANEDSDEWGLTVCGQDDQAPPHYYVLEDASAIYTPDQACDKALFLYSKWKADRIVAEVNNGGDMIETILRAKNQGFAYRGVRASHGKYSRAEPISALYEQKRAHNVGYFAVLEAQATDYVPGVSKKSPDRLDSMVWAMTDLSEGWSGGWAAEAARKHATENPKISTPNESLDATDKAKTLAAAQKAALTEQPSSSNIFGAEKMSGKVLTTKMVKPLTNDKTPKCPSCGNPNLAHTGQTIRCTCGWNNLPEIDQDGNPVIKKLA